MSSEVAAASLPVRAPGSRRWAGGARSATTDLAVLLASAAGLVHAISTPAHLRWWRASGYFFIALAVFQLGLALVLFLNRAGLRTVLAGIWGNVAVVLVYVVSRTVGLPGEPAITAHGAPLAPGRAIIPGAVEKVGPFDLFSLFVELALVVVLVSMLPDSWRGRTSSALMCVGLGLWGLAAFGILS
jgi:hypothetical protein